MKNNAHAKGHSVGSKDQGRKRVKITGKYNVELLVLACHVWFLQKEKTTWIYIHTRDLEIFV